METPTRIQARELSARLRGLREDESLVKLKQRYMAKDARAVLDDIADGSYDDLPSELLREAQHEVEKYIT